MLTPAQIDHIQSLLHSNEQLSYRAIAARAGVSRRTVSQIASGRRASCRRQEPTWDDSLDYQPTANIGRCPDCGSRVVLPCVACRAQRYRRFQHWGKDQHRGCVARGECLSLRRPA